MAKTKVTTTFHKNATARCQNCSSVFTLGMTIESLTVEICGSCHPFYTGQETLVDTAGRIEKFQARLSKATDDTSKSIKVKARKTKQSLADLSEAENS